MNTTLFAVVIPGGTHVYPNCFAFNVDVFAVGLNPSLSLIEVTCS